MVLSRFFSFTEQLGFDALLINIPKGRLHEFPYVVKKLACYYDRQIVSFSLSLHPIAFVLRGSSFSTWLTNKDELLVNSGDRWAGCNIPQ